MTFDYLYSLTLRQYMNVLNGYQKKQDLLSRERWMLTRKMMYATLIPYGKIKETDIMEFAWESEVISEISEKESEEILEDIDKNTKPFWEKWDLQQNQNLN